MTKVLIYLFFLVGVVVMLAGGCKKDDDKNLTLPILTTSAVNEITQTSAICGGNITSDGGSAITVSGICWSTDPNPIMAGSKTTDGTTNGSFKSPLTGLKPNNTYYTWAYATNSVGTGFGSPVLFNTKYALVDFDGNVYDTVMIGTQVWMKQNLNVTHYSNGDPLPNVAFYAHSFTGAYSNYYDRPDTSKIYGRLYNWYALNDNRNIAPKGWHVASDVEWSILIAFLGGENIAGSKLKEVGIAHWISQNQDATNESGFTALPGGSVKAILGHNGQWWTSTSTSDSSYYAWNITMSHLSGGAYRNNYEKYLGFSVRCVKD